MDESSAHRIVIRPEVVHDLEALGYRNVRDRLMAGITARHPGVEVHFAEESTYPADALVVCDLLSAPPVFSDDVQ